MMYQKSVLLKKELHWRLNCKAHRQHYSIKVQSWLYETDSLTQRLRTQYGQTVAVKVLRQTWQKPFISEQILLNNPIQRYCLVREVLLYYGDLPLILARTVIPHTTVQTVNNQFLTLGNRPIGEILFSYRPRNNKIMDFTLVPTELWTNKIKQTIDIKHAIYGRRTRHYLANQPLLVSEFFLPAVLETITT